MDPFLFKEQQVVNMMSRRNSIGGEISRRNSIRSLSELSRQGSLQFFEPIVVELAGSDDEEEDDRRHVKHTHLLPTAESETEIDDDQFMKCVLSAQEERKDEEAQIEMVALDGQAEKTAEEEPEVKITTAAPKTTKALSERHHLEFMMIMIGGIALAFNAGFVNSSTLLIGDTPVSHISGTSSRAGIYLGEGDFYHFGVKIALIVSYVVGAAITGAMMPKDSFHLGREYGPLFVIGSILFSLSCVSKVYLPHSRLFYYFAAMACGLQNGMTTKYSGNIIRTTHMTGAGTDVGLVLGRMLMGDHKERWKLSVLVPLMISFIIGGTVSVFVHRELGDLTLVVNVIVFFSIGVTYSIIIGRELHIPVWRALFGLYVTVEKNVKRKKVIEV